MEKFDETQINESLKKLSGWNYDGDVIHKSFQFKDFKETFALMTQIAFECEELNHHPNWENVYNNLTIKLNTHDADGITQKDFDLAKRIENIVSSK